MYQKIIVVGYLGGDPEMRYMPDGTAVTNFNMATSRRWNDRSGQQVDETTWFRVSVWGRRAEAANQYLSKGQRVLVEGRLRPDPQTGGPRLWTGQDGVPRASFEISATDFEFMSSRQEAAAGYSSDDFGARGGGAAPAQEEDEIPF